MTVILSTVSLDTIRWTAERAERRGVAVLDCGVTGGGGKPPSPRLVSMVGGGDEAFARALGGQGISIVSYSKNKDEAMKFLEWFIRDDVQKKWAELGGYTCSQAVLKSEKFQNATPYNKAFYDTMFMVKDFWAVPEYAELLTAINTRAYPFIIGGEGTAKDVLDATAADWNATFKKYGYVQ